MALLFDVVRRFFLEQGLYRRYIVGYSGGLDSQVLLHLCTEFRALHPLLFSAVYIHHGLSKDASEWSMHCQQQCVQWQIDFLERAVELPRQSGSSLEELAREYRYGVFSECLQPGDVLLTAHHEDDQAETLLVQLSRGAGIKGLSAMPSMKSLGSGYHARPLLSFSRHKLEQYAKEHQLQWIEDESNRDTRLTRNFFRHDILPLLRQRWPSIAETLSKVAGHCAEAQGVLDELAEKDWAFCRKQDRILSIKSLSQLTPARQRQVLRYWFQRLDILCPSAKVLHHIQHDFLLSAPDKSPFVSWGDVELRRYRDGLYIMTCLALHDTTQTIAWNTSQPLVIPSIGVLAIMSPTRILMVRFRQGGERCYFARDNTHRLLKNLWQEWGVPPWLRDRIPLLYDQEELIGVVGYFMRDNQT